jgi:hypothetical protein
MCAFESGGGVSSPRRQFVELADEFQTLTSVCRLIARRSGDPAIGEELRELAEAIEFQVELLRAAARLLA